MNFQNLNKRISQIVFHSTHVLLRNSFPMFSNPLIIRQLVCMPVGEDIKQDVLKINRGVLDSKRGRCPGIVDVNPKPFPSQLLVASPTILKQEAILKYLPDI